MRIPYEENNEVDVPMSPLIDCVFLLLIFFLVTTQMKKWEKQIPLTLPTITSSLSTVQSGEDAVIIAVDEDKNIFEIITHDAYSGKEVFVPIDDITTFLNNLRSQKGVEIAIDISAYRNVPVSTVIEIFDKCQQEGFTQSRVRLGSKPETDEYTP